MHLKKCNQWLKREMLNNHQLETYLDRLAIKETSGKLNYLYDLLDAGYDADIIREYSKLQGHRPIMILTLKSLEPK